MFDAEEAVPDTQSIIRNIINQLRDFDDITAVLDQAIKGLTKLIRADRGVIWLMGRDRDELVAVSEFTQDDQRFFDGARLRSWERMHFLGWFDTRYLYGVHPNDTIAIADTAKDYNLNEAAPTLAALIQEGDVRARLVAKISSRGSCHGIAELQQIGIPRKWTKHEEEAVERVAEVLAVALQHSIELMEMQEGTNELGLLNLISRLLRESNGWQDQETLRVAVKALSNFIGFEYCQLFAYDEGEQLLVPQMSGKEHSENIALAGRRPDWRDSPFAEVFKSGSLKVVGLNSFNDSKIKDPFFGDEIAMIVPLSSRAEKLGVMGFWKRKPGLPSPLRPKDKELAVAVADTIASFRCRTDFLS
jgi:hypothetical protein